ncbi:hypothetical protein P9Z87_04115, partial [Bacillus cereus]|nr:hypothetical protein [Bacillus cereus]
CIEQKILLPGVSVLTKLVAKVRDRASENLWEKLAELPCTEQRKQLENLLQSGPKKKKTHLERLSNPPFTIRGTASISEKNHAKDFFYKKSRYIKNKTALLYVKDVNSFAQCHVILQICILQEN